MRAPEPIANPGTSPTPGYLIWGAAGGMGQALARRLNQTGATLFLAGRTATRLQPLA